MIFVTCNKATKENNTPLHIHMLCIHTYIHLSVYLLHISICHVSGLSIIYPVDSFAKVLFSIYDSFIFFLLGKEDGEGQEIWGMVKNREAWCTAMLGVTKSWTRLRD